MLILTLEMWSIFCRHKEKPQYGLCTQTKIQSMNDKRNRFSPIFCTLEYSIPIEFDANKFPIYRNNEPNMNYLSFLIFARLRFLVFTRRNASFHMTDI